jgi:hypothetical protein
MATLGTMRLPADARSSRSRAALALIVVAYTATHAIIKPGIRYILPAVPVAAMLAAAALPRRPRPRPGGG